jgi:hypothetical protein
MHCTFYDNEKLFRRVHFLTCTVCIVILSELYVYTISGVAGFYGNRNE